MTLTPEDEATAVRSLELMSRLTVFCIEEAHTHADRLALRVALSLLAVRLMHPADEVKAFRIECELIERLAS